MIIKSHCLPGGYRNPNNWMPLCGWSENTIIQWGRPEGDTFFEVFPDNPKTMIHCSGVSLEDAEKKSWTIFQRYLACPQHEFERGEYTNGYATCKHCGLTTKSFEPIEYCCQCNNPKGYGRDTQNRWWCENCYANMPQELWSDIRKMIEAEKNEPISDEDFNEALTEVITHLSKKV